MKKAIAVSIIFVMVSAINLFAQTMSDPNKKITITIPQNWSKDAKGSATGFSLSSNANTETSAANIQVDVSSGEGVTLEVLAPELIKEYSNMDKTAKILEKGYITVGGLKAYKIVLSMTSEGIDMKIKTVAIINKGSFCNIVFTSTLDAYEPNQPALESLLKSIVWK